jgi:hypothetical protein
MSTGAVLTHGVSGYPCLGRAGDFQEQLRGQPWESVVNDPISSYLNAQNHIGVMMSNFNEPWSGGALQDLNYNSQPYRTPIVGRLDAPASTEKRSILTATVEYPSHLGLRADQQLPIARIHSDVNLPVTYRQNLVWENGGVNGSNQVLLPPTQIPTTPNTQPFQGSTTSSGVHPNNDKSGQQTTANTTRPDMRGGQLPTMRLPNGMSIGMMQPNEPPQLWEMAPPPDPQVIPGEGTAPLAPTTPAWW